MDYSYPSPTPDKHVANTSLPSSLTWSPYTESKLSSPGLCWSLCLPYFRPQLLLTSWRTHFADFLFSCFCLLGRMHAPGGQSRLWLVHYHIPRAQSGAWHIVKQYVLNEHKILDRLITVSVIHPVLLFKEKVLSLVLAERRLFFSSAVAMFSTIYFWVSPSCTSTLVDWTWGGHRTQGQSAQRLLHGLDEIT